MVIKMLYYFIVIACMCCCLHASGIQDSRFLRLSSAKGLSTFCASVCATRQDCMGFVAISRCEFLNTEVDVGAHCQLYSDKPCYKKITTEAITTTKPPPTTVKTETTTTPATTAAATSAPSTSCDASMTSLDSSLTSVYKLFTNLPSSHFDTSYTVCRGIQTHLVAINTENEHQKIKDLLNAQSPLCDKVWIGAHGIVLGSAALSSWHWNMTDHTVPFTYAKWGSGSSGDQPDNATGDQSKISLNKSPTYDFFDMKPAGVGNSVYCCVCECETA